MPVLHRRITQGFTHEEVAYRSIGAVRLHSVYPGHYGFDTDERSTTYVTIHGDGEHDNVCRGACCLHGVFD